ncbi:hypothetical protein [Aliiroseovarius zhejiangensis]|nr:hypothetical protein [Aliiroseovarius zhejiangensis]
MFDQENGNKPGVALCAGGVCGFAHPIGSATENEYRRSEGMTRHG